MIGTARGMSIRFDVDDVRPIGRDTRGVHGIELREGDRVIGMDVIETDEQQVLTVSANGYGKRTPDRRVARAGPRRPRHHRDGHRERNGEVVHLCLVTHRRPAHVHHRTPAR